MAETGIDYEAQAYEAMQKGDPEAALVWATLHQARMTRELMEVMAETREILREWKQQAGGFIPRGPHAR